MDVRLGLPTRDAYPGEPVAVDLELFGAEEERLHRPDTGTFAALGIAMGSEAFLLEDSHDVNEALRRIRHGMWVIQQATFDLMHLRRWSHVKPAKVWDTMLVEQDLFGGWYDRFGLDDLARRWLGVYLEKETRDRFETLASMDEESRAYAITDPIITLQIQAKQAEYVRMFTSDFRWYWEIDYPMIDVVLDMKGALVDRKMWRELLEGNKRSLKERLAELPFNPRSPAQVKNYMSETYGITMRDSEHDTLEKTARDHPRAAEIIAKIIAARESGTLVSTYGESWLRHVGDDGYANPHWKIVGPETGRTACAHPNMQQVPIRKNPEYRKAIIASPGNQIIVSDVNQQEVRYTAFFSQDRYLMKALNSREDTHLVVARAVFQDDTIVKADPRRRIGKDINLGLSYGLTAKGLSRNANIPLQLAEKILRQYFISFPGVKDSQRRFLKQAMDTYFVRTASGRPVYINPYSRQWENNAINSPIQGTGGDQLKLAARLIRERSLDRGMPQYITLLVHDEIVEDVPIKDVKAYKEITESAWIDAADYLAPGLPMVTDIASGDDWGCKT